MTTKARARVRRAFGILMLSCVYPAVAAGQGNRIAVSVHGAVGTHYGDGGDSQSVGLGIWFGERFGAVFNVERSHVPTDITFFEDGYAATRGATTRFVSGEFRYVPVTFKGISPYIVAGIGVGTSRPNVNEFFPDPVTHTVIMQIPGFGAGVRLTEQLSAFADLRIMFQHRRGVPDAGVFGPLRAGIAWRF